jgi:hypothetical protein
MNFYFGEDLAHFLKPRSLSHSHSLLSLPHTRAHAHTHTQTHTHTHLYIYIQTTKRIPNKVCSHTELQSLHFVSEAENVQNTTPQVPLICTYEIRQLVINCMLCPLCQPCSISWSPRDKRAYSSAGYHPVNDLTVGWICYWRCKLEIIVRI